MNIDYEKIGTGLYNILNEGDKAVVAFGMVPLHIMESVTKMMCEKVAHLTCEKWQISTDVMPPELCLWGEEDPDQKWIDKLAKSVRPEFIAEFQRKVTVAIFAAAKNAGMMIA